MKPNTSASSVGIIALSYAAGATNAFAFLTLGGVFAGNITGNFILMDLPQHPEYLFILVGALVAVAASVVVSLVIGFSVTRSREGVIAYSPVFGVLIASTAVQLVVAVGWLLLPTRSAFWTQCIFVVFAAAAVALQRVVARRIFAATELPTPLARGSVAAIVEDLVSGKAGPLQALRLSSVVALIVGVVSAGVTLFFATPLGAFPPVVGALVAFFATRAALPDR